ncbi:Snurportin-1 [Grifola frondosa]|uniref:Snurportin-1 n=1 Tax=Grifola frondosa TaxID=5627 RepID=A0A1C7MMH5_GRIFR|nr:Snurportin-1 [Grifola frondosa]
MYPCASECRVAPSLLGILLFEAMVFGFSIGINTTNAVFLGTPPPGGYGFSQFAIAGAYGTPIVAVLIGEVLGRYFNDWVMNLSIRRNNGVFVAENRLWTCYIAIPLYICGFLVLGASFQKHLSVGALVMGWGIAEVAVMINTVAVYAYCNDCFPTKQGEISALINLARTLGGFSVAFFQVPWAMRNGALQTFGVEAAIVVALFFLIVPALQLKGARLRERFSIATRLTELQDSKAINSISISQHRRNKALDDQKRRRAERIDSTRQLDLFAGLTLGPSDEEAEGDDDAGPDIACLQPLSFPKRGKKNKGKGKARNALDVDDAIGKPKAARANKQNKWADKCMYAELLEMNEGFNASRHVEDGMPDDIETAWVAVTPVPVGKRCLAVTHQASGIAGVVSNTTLRSRVLGKALMQPFPSTLPPQTVLDCILDENWRYNGILHVLDVLQWKAQDLVECDTPFRFWWRDTRLSELPNFPPPTNAPGVQDSTTTSQSSYQFPYPTSFVPIPYHTDTTLPSLTNTLIPLTRTSRNIPISIPTPLTMNNDNDMDIDENYVTPSAGQLRSVLTEVKPDGMLLYVAQATYESGTSPLSSWVPLQTYVNHTHEVVASGSNAVVSESPLAIFERLARRRLALTQSGGAFVGGLPEVDMISK